MFNATALQARHCYPSTDMRQFCWLHSVVYSNLVLVESCSFAESAHITEIISKIPQRILWVCKNCRVQCSMHKHANRTIERRTDDEESYAHFVKWRQNFLNFNDHIICLLHFLHKFLCQLLPFSFSLCLHFRTDHSASCKPDVAEVSLFTRNIIPCSDYAIVALKRCSKRYGEKRKCKACKRH